VLRNEGACDITVDIGYGLKLEERLSLLGETPEAADTTEG